MHSGREAEGVVVVPADFARHARPGTQQLINAYPAFSFIGVPAHNILLNKFGPRNRSGFWLLFAGGTAFSVDHSHQFMQSFPARLLAPFEFGGAIFFLLRLVPQVVDLLEDVVLPKLVGLLLRDERDLGGDIGDVFSLAAEGGDGGEELLLVELVGVVGIEYFVDLQTAVAFDPG